MAKKGSKWPIGRVTSCKPEGLTIPTYMCLNEVPRLSGYPLLTVTLACRVHGPLALHPRVLSRYFSSGSPYVLGVLPGSLDPAQGGCIFSRIRLMLCLGFVKGSFTEAYFWGEHA